MNRSSSGSTTSNPSLTPANGHAHGAAGRERAIETILDRDPRGCFYRAARVVEESVPLLLSSRPNLVTKSALMEQAWSLQKYEFDRSLPYDPGAMAVTETCCSLSFDAVTRERIVHHLERGLKGPGTPKVGTKVASALRTIYEENPLKQKVPTVEDSFLTVCKQQDDLVTVLTAILSLLTAVEGGEEAASDDDVEVSFPVAHLLALLETSNTDEFGVSREWVDYFGQAAAVSEERLEIQKARLLARITSSEPEVLNPAATTITTPAAATPTTATSPPTVVSASSPPDELVAAAAAAQALSAAFEQVLSRSAASTLQDEDDDEDEDSSNAISDDDSDDDDEEEEEEDNEDTTTHTASAGGTAVLESERGGVDETTASEFDDDNTVLRQALHLSRLAVAAAASSSTPVVPETEVFSEEAVVEEDDMTSERAQQELDELLKDDDDSSNLPPLPRPPVSPLPFGTVGDTSVLDPSILSRFGAIPASHVLLHFLRYSNFLLGGRKSDSEKNESLSVVPTPGGMGALLFEASTAASATAHVRAKYDDGNLALQLAVATLFLILEKRDDAIAGLQKAVIREQHREDPSINTAASAYASAVVDSDEEDDPADTFAMNYVEDDVELSSEALENKGMRRKAAAAAYDAAALLKSLQKRTHMAKVATKLYSYAALYAIRTLRLLLRENPTLSFPAAERLSTALVSFLSVSTHSSYAELLPNEDAKVFLSLDLYREAVWAWGECVPILYSLDQSLSVLRSLIEECSLLGREESCHAQSVDDFDTFPKSELESKLHKLQVLCRRLRVGDMLDKFVSRPIPLVVDDDDSSATTTAMAQQTIPSDPPRRSSSLISVLGHSRTLVMDAAKEDIERLYLALCHRCHVRVFLMDGLLEEMADDPPGAVKAPKSLATGDTLRVSFHPGHTFQFDSAKCADSMAILTDATTNGPSVHQRASKVWGAVLATQHFNPKSGVHRWAVRLDKCERGHVFVGVATAQASMKTYVGGDKYGWGMIGTQALWHDRRKIRGDYGATFRTGSTIIVTLDTDAGTLSFSSWKDSSSTTSSFALDSASQTLASPRRSGHVHGTIEDWGVAFEGLPLDSRLYPAVGLYQRDDRVTLLSVESGNGSVNGEVDSGCFFPGNADCEEAVRVRQYNDLLTWDAIQYATDVLERSTEALKQNDTFFVTSLLPSLAASMSLIPRTVPVLSSRFGFFLLPHLRCCISTLEQCRRNRESSINLYRAGPRAGKWAIRATGTSGNTRDFEEYIVDFESRIDDSGALIGFEGKGVGTTGKSKNGLVSIVGAFSGSSVTFVEEWSDGSEGSFPSDDASSCVVSARLSLDGERFEGLYRNVQYGTTGQIVGMRTEGPGRARLKDAPSSENSVETDSSIRTCEATLCLALCHLATIIGEDASNDLEEKGSIILERRNALSRSLSGPVLSSCSLAATSLSLDNEKAFIRHLYAPPSPLQGIGGMRVDDLLESTQMYAGLVKSFSISCQDFDIFGSIDELDDTVSAQIGGKGSLSGLCRDEYSSARRHIIAVLLCFSGQLEDLFTAKANITRANDLSNVWRGAMHLMEDAVRTAISKPDGRTHQESCAATCKLLLRGSEFLLALERLDVAVASLPDVVKELGFFYRMIENESDIELLRTEMVCASRRGVMRLVAFESIVQLICGKDSICTVAIECLIAGLPRLLGRGRTESTAIELREDEYPDLDGNYLSGLSGASCLVRSAISDRVHGLYRNLGTTLDRQLSRRSSAPESLVIVDSLVLSILAVFSGNLSQRGGASACIRESGILQCIPRIIFVHRPAILGETETSEKESEFSSVRKILAICQRDRSRSILHGSVAALHVLTYQVARDASDPTALEQCLTVLLGELELSLPYLKADVPSGDRGPVTVDEELEKWSGACCPKTDSPAQVEEQTARQLGDTGVRYLRDHGTIVNSAALHTLTKPSRPKVAGSRPGATVKSRSGFCYLYFSNLIHVLCCALRFRSSLVMVARNDRWLEILVEAAGMTLLRSADGSFDRVFVNSERLLPAKCRCRILRSLLPLLQSTNPSCVLADALLILAGHASNGSTQNLDEEEGFVSREAATLLRHLHSPASPCWRDCINRSIGGCTVKSTELHDIWKKIGVLCFFSGDLGSIARGSYVLMKPPAAASLSQEHQSTPNSKGHAGGVGGNSPPLTGVTPHHIVGNGTESVVAGLCRRDASAGIVSNLDPKNGVCEVILLGRDADEAVESQGSVSKGPTRNSIGGRHTLTVRALRTPLSDVVLAQEVALHLDRSVPSSDLVGTMLISSLERLIELASSQELAKEAIQELGPTESKLRRDVSSDLLVLRSCIVLLSDRQLLSDFLVTEQRAWALSKLLHLAWPENRDSDSSFDLKIRARGNFLSSLPAHEARYGHLLAVLRETSVRIDSLRRSTDVEWEEKLDKYQVHFKEGVKESPAIPVSASNVSPRTPPSGTSVVGTTRDAVARESDSQESSRSISQSTGGSNSDDDEESEAAAATAVAHLREAAIAQMSELGLPRSWSELALRRTGGTNIEAAVTFCLERSGEMERLLAEERERDRMLQRGTASSASRRRGTRDSTTNHLLRQLQDMGFPARWCAEALAVTGNNVDEALTWILTNGERLSEEDEGMEAEADAGEGEVDEGDDDSLDDEDEEDDDPGDTTVEESQEATAETVEHPEVEQAHDTESVSHVAESVSGWTGSIIPLRFISGRANINPKTLEVSGLPTGGFTSVGTKGVLLTSGKWYYEAVLQTAGCLQIGWADSSFAQHCNSDRGDGCGDGPSSWSFDGWRRYRWHSTATEWGCRWMEGDVIGCLVDMDQKIVSFLLNGKGESIGMGVAFSGRGFRPTSGVYACVSFNRREKLRLILGGSGSHPFKYPPPPGFRGVGEAVLEATQELGRLLEKESILEPLPGASPSDAKKFLCDFSDGEHGHELMAWAHRYYGSDASVHLGSARSKLPTGSSKSSSPTASEEPTVSACCSLRAERAWLKCFNDEHRTDLSNQEVRSLIMSGYYDVHKSICLEIRDECFVIAVLLARKLLLHIMITLGREFNPLLMVPDPKEEHPVTRLLWKVLEDCTSLRSVGWVGEAGSMAVAAEALGLGISSTEHLQPRSSSHDRTGVPSAVDLDGLCLPSAGITQLLSSVRVGKSADDTSESLASCAEAAIGSDSGGALLSFLRDSLQSAVCHSSYLRKLIIATIRRGVRLLAVVEYDGDPPGGDAAEDDEDSSDRAGSPFTRNAGAKQDAEDSQISALNPDARLIAYLSGLLLSRPVRESVGVEVIECALAESWSVGLLSASLPWRMICAFTVAGIFNENPRALTSVLSCCSTLARYFGRLPSTLTRRIWAERAASPVCSRYVQSMVELVAAVKRSASLVSQLPNEFKSLWSQIEVDSATPVPLKSSLVTTVMSPSSGWEADEGYVSSDSSWDVWLGSVELFPVDWKTPTRSGVRALVDAGQGPPRLGEGSLVLRGSDWQERWSNEDGHDKYEAEKAKREKEKSYLDEQETGIDPADSPQKEGNETSTVNDDNVDPAADPEHEPEEGHENPESKTKSKGGDDAKKKRRKKLPSPKLPVGTVLSVEPWNGVPAMARRVRWELTGEVGVYRYGGDGKFDLCHVETNTKHTRVRKRHPLPESAEQCAARHGFGVKRSFKVLLRLSQDGEVKLVDDQVEYRRQGILEWPDFGAGARVSVTLSSNGSVCLEEQDLLFGAKDSGWEARFGQPSFEPGTLITLTPTCKSTHKNQADLDTKSSSLSIYDELLGSTTFSVKHLRDRSDGSVVKVTSEMRLYRGRLPSFSGRSLKFTAPSPPMPLSFDSEYHATSISLSRDGRTASCTASDGRGTAFASIGFTKGTHYWEVKLEQADIGSVFVGVAEKPSGSGSGSSFGYDSPPRLNRWHGWGFVNFRATYTSGAERVYGAHCHAGDTIGVLLDCDAGRISFFFDGLKYGEHILQDLGVGFETLSPFDFNVDGCGSGGAGQGAPSGFEGGRGGRQPAQGAVRPRTLWPVIGLRNQGDRVTFSAKWSTSYGIDGSNVLRNVLAVDDILDYLSQSTVSSLPSWFVSEAFSEYRRWCEGVYSRSVSRGSGQYKLTSYGLDLDLDASPQACAAASAGLGLSYALLAGDRVRLTRSAGRILELAEEAVVLGAYQGRLYYRIVSQKSEGGSLTEGGGRAWCWDESEVVDGLPFVRPGKGLGVNLPKLDRFRCLSNGGLRIVYDGGAVLRSDLEIFDGSSNLGTVPVNTVIPQADVLERRVNSCGVVRYRVRYNDLEGWISARIRGGKEEMIVQPAEDPDKVCDALASFPTPFDCAVPWYSEWLKKSHEDPQNGDDLRGLEIQSLEDFEMHLSQAIIPGLSQNESDCLLAGAINAISNFTEGGSAVECPLREVASALSFVVAFSCSDKTVQISGSSPGADQAVAAVFSNYLSPLPPLRSLLARIALLRAFNRRVRLALPWLPLRPCQEGSAILGGLIGHGTSTERAGRARVTPLSDSWVQVPSIALRLRYLRGLVFSSVKRDLLQSITETTTTPTPLSHDEYELPREIRTVRINRLKAARAMESEDNSAKRKYSVFAQLQNEIRNWGGAALRRGYVAKGHGGQKRAFKVKLIGEGVNDYSGPYREAFTDAIAELAKTDANGQGYLGVLDRTPNNVSGIGENRDLLMLSLNGLELTPLKEKWSGGSVSETERLMRQNLASLLTARDETSREVEEALVFLGRITGTAYRHGIPLDLPLPLLSFWKCLTEEPTPKAKQLRELDYLAHRQLEDDFSPLLWWEQRMLNSFVEGLGNVLPVELFPLFTGEELRDTLCGNPEVDVDLLKRVVEYEGYDPDDAVIDNFWQTLREFSNDERKHFLQFVWARNRLPMRESDFEAPFKIQKDAINVGARADQALPSASTCFFSLTLPNYSSREILKAKLLFAINNVTTMETDFQTNSAEISEGYRTFS